MRIGLDVNRVAVDADDVPGALMVVSQRLLDHIDVELAQRIYAGSDLFLMPSRFEPCGLGQMIALRYGTLPIVRATGGLADTVHDFDPVINPQGNGFVFTEYRAPALLQTVRRAVAAFQDQFGADWVPAAGKQAR